MRSVFFTISGSICRSPPSFLTSQCAPIAPAREVSISRTYGKCFLRYPGSISLLLFREINDRVAAIVEYEFQGDLGARELHVKFKVSSSAGPEVLPHCLASPVFTNREREFFPGGQRGEAEVRAPEPTAGIAGGYGDEKFSITIRI